MPTKKIHDAKMVMMDTATGETIEMGEPVELEMTVEAEEPQERIRLTDELEISGELELTPGSAKALKIILLGIGTNNDFKRHHMPKRRKKWKI